MSRDKLVPTNGAFFRTRAWCRDVRSAKTESNTSHQKRRNGAGAGGLYFQRRVAVQTLVPTKWSPPACKKGEKKTGHKVLIHARCKVDRGTERVSLRAPRPCPGGAPAAFSALRSATAGTFSLTRRASQSHCLMHVCATTVEGWGE